MEIARDERTSCYQVNRAFAVGGDELLARLESARARRLSLDGAQHRRGHELATVVSDLDCRRVIAVPDGRSRRVVECYLRSLPAPDRDAIGVASIDPDDAHRQAICNELATAAEGHTSQRSS